MFRIAELLAKVKRKFPGGRAVDVSGCRIRARSPAFPMRILTSEEVRQAEREATKRAGVSTATLMHAAGYAVAQFCLAHFKFSSVCVVCGKGNNGGDGLVAAEALRGSASK